MAAKQTERKTILDHLKEIGSDFKNPKDLYTYMSVKLNEKDPAFVQNKEYVQKLLDAGYSSTMANNFFEEYKNHGKMKNVTNIQED